jgi:hypothetical protein
VEPSHFRYWPELHPESARFGVAPPEETSGAVALTLVTVPPELVSLSAAQAQVVPFHFGISLVAQPGRSENVVPLRARPEPAEYVALSSAAQVQPGLSDFQISPIGQAPRAIVVPLTLMPYPAV